MMEGKYSGVNMFLKVKYTVNVGILMEISDVNGYA